MDLIFGTFTYPPFEVIFFMTMHLLGECSVGTRWDSTDDSKSLLLGERSVAAQPLGHCSSSARGD